MVVLDPADPCRDARPCPEEVPVLRTSTRRTVHLLCGAAAGTAVLLAAAPAASAQPASTVTTSTQTTSTQTSEETTGEETVCTKGRPTRPGVALPCHSPASGQSPVLTDNLGRKL